MAAATLATPAVAAPAQPQMAAPASRISWTACSEAELEGMQCGTLRVPVDYAHPHAGSLSLALVRRPADDQAHRQGALLLNDGAGGSSIEQLRLAMRIGFPSFAGAMSRNFDLVAVDPRGVGHSTPIRCTTPLKPAGVTHFPHSQAEFDTLVAHNRAFAADCLRKNGPMVAHTDLTSTARDFEAVCTGLGEKQLNWYGIHYSTLLGRTYTHLYRGRLRTMVLDTALDDTLVAAGTPVHGAPPALILQSTHQALAPHSAGFAMAAQLPGSVVLSREGDDYSMFLLSLCVRDATNRYLTTRALPAPGTTCTD